MSVCIDAEGLRRHILHQLKHGADPYTAAVEWLNAHGHPHQLNPETVTRIIGRPDNATTARRLTNGITRQATQ